MKSEITATFLADAIEQTKNFQNRVRKNLSHTNNAHTLWQTNARTQISKHFWPAHRRKSTKVGLKEFQPNRPRRPTSLETGCCFDRNGETAKRAKSKRRRNNKKDLDFVLPSPLQFDCNHKIFGKRIGYPSNCPSFRLHSKLYKDISRHLAHVAHFTF